MCFNFAMRVISAVTLKSIPLLAMESTFCRQKAEEEDNVIGPFLQAF